MIWNRLKRIYSGSGWKSKRLYSVSKPLCKKKNLHKQKLNGSKHYWLNPSNKPLTITMSSAPKRRCCLRFCLI